jgi:hypothetical protein
VHSNDYAPVTKDGDTCPFRDMASTVGASVKRLGVRPQLVTITHLKSLYENCIFVWSILAVLSWIGWIRKRKCSKTLDLPRDNN